MYTKAIVISKEYPNLYNKEVFVLWITQTPNGKFYHVSQNENDIICQVYLGETQIQLL